MKINFSKLFKSTLIAAAAVTVIGVLLLVIFGGKTAATYTMQNLRISLFVKAFVASVLVLAATMLYFIIRFKKNGVFLGLYTAMSAVISAVVAFSVCVICRAPLGELTFALMLLAVMLSYITAVVFVNNFSAKNTSRKKSAAVADDNYTTAADKTWAVLRYLVTVICIVLVAAFVIALIFAVKAVPFYALPAIFVTVFSVIQTIAVGCKFYSAKV